MSNVHGPTDLVVGLGVYRCGSAGHVPPRVSVAMAMSASGEWKPYALLVIARKWVLVASTRAFDSPTVIAL